MSAKVKKQSTLPFKKKRSSTVYFPQFPDYNLEELEFELDRPRTAWSADKIQAFVEKIDQIKKKNRLYSADGAQWISIARYFNLANAIFGYNGWYTSVLNPGTFVSSEINLKKADHIRTDNYFELLKAEQEDVAEYNLDQVPDEKAGFTYSVAAVAEVELKLKDGTLISAQGDSKVTNMPLKSMAFHKAKKEAVTNATKNCFLRFPELVVNHRDRWKVNQFNWG